MCEEAKYSSGRNLGTYGRRIFFRCSERSAIAPIRVRSLPTVKNIFRIKLFCEGYNIEEGNECRGRRKVSPRESNIFPVLDLPDVTVVRPESPWLPLQSCE